RRHDPRIFFDERVFGRWKTGNGGVRRVVEGRIGIDGEGGLGRSLRGDRIEPMSPLQGVLLFGSAALGGALNSVAGGGSFLPFPALLFTGIAPVTANARSSVALWPAAVSASFAYRRELSKSKPILVPLSVASAVGGLI